MKVLKIAIVQRIEAFSTSSREELVKKRKWKFLHILTI